MQFPHPRDQFRLFPALAELNDSQLDWLLDRCEEYSFATGEYLSRSGDEATKMLFILEGAFQARADNGEGPTYTMSAGMISGFLPFSRMTHFPLSSRAIAPTRALALDKCHFPALYQEVPDLIPKLVGILTDRVRESARAITQTDKLAAIGKLSAGLAHELNNPAAAAKQASTSAKQIFDCYRETLDQLAALCSSKEIYAQVQALEAQAADAVRQPTPLDSLTQSDREEEIIAWLDSIGAEDGWRGAPAFVAAGFTAESLAAATAHWPPEVRELALFRMAAGIEMEQVLAQMAHATSRMSSLVSAMKDYSFMDRAPADSIDLNQSLETTLLIFSFRFKSGIELVKKYDPDLPKVSGNGGELAQVWTNLIDNALDAMEASPAATGQLRITTRRQLDDAIIEIHDNGPGIPPENLARIYDPFFTTKPQGEGTGLGLDTVYRIIRQHQGSITVESCPGNTTFTVCLPSRAQG